MTEQWKPKVGERVYWRWKGAKIWSRDYCYPLSSGLARMCNTETQALREFGSIVALDEIELRPTDEKEKR